MAGFDPQQLKQFLFDHVAMLEEVQVLSWFHRHPAITGTESRIAHDTGISSGLVSEALERLTAAGVLASVESTEPEFRYDPKDATLGETLQQVVDLYRDDPRRVLEIMTANAMDRLRTRTAQAFAEAFRIRIK